MFMFETYKAIATALTGTVTLDGVVVPFYTGTFVPKETGIYISGYAERNADLKQSYGALCDVTITCFVKNGPIDNVVDVANQIEEQLGPGVNDTLSLDTLRLTVQQKITKIYFQDIQDGQQVERIDLTFSLLIDV
jgi:hypothetical protein